MILHQGFISKLSISSFSYPCNQTSLTHSLAFGLETNPLLPRPGRLGLEKLFAFVFAFASSFAVPSKPIVEAISSAPALASLTGTDSKEFTP
jgi:hypothetical protein